MQSGDSHKRQRDTVQQNVQFDGTKVAHLFFPTLRQISSNDVESIEFTINLNAGLNDGHI